MLNLQEYLLNGGTLSNLEKDPFNLKIAKEYPYVIFKYDQISSRFSESIVEESRGIILNQHNWEVACHPFKKFYNYSEGRAADVDLSKATIFRKYDGSLIKIWYDSYNENWRISTNGMIDANEATLEFMTSRISSFEDLVLDVLNGTIGFTKLTDRLDTNISYMFELLHPQNVIVEEHKEKELVLIGAKTNSVPYIDYDIRSDEFKLLTEVENVSVSKTFDVDKTSFDVIMDEASKFNSEDNIFEGFVIAEIKDGNVEKRVKLKTPMYLKYHRLTDRKHSDNIFMEVFKDNEFEEFESYLDQAPSFARERYFELKEKFVKIVDDLEIVVKQARELFKKYKEEYPDNYQAEFGKMVQKNYKKSIQGFIFENVYKDTSVKEYLKRMSINKLKKGLLNDI